MCVSSIFWLPISRKDAGRISPEIARKWCTYVRNHNTHTALRKRNSFRVYEICKFLDLLYSCYIYPVWTLKSVNFSVYYIARSTQCGLWHLQRACFRGVAKVSEIDMFSVSANTWEGSCAYLFVYRQYSDCLFVYRQYSDCLFVYRQYSDPLFV